MEPRKFTWKRLIIPIAFCLLIGAVCFIGFNFSGEDKVETQVPYYSYTQDKSEYVLENDQLKFALNADTTQFSVTKKNTGVVWNSNPSDTDNDSIAVSADKGKLKSTLLITYSNDEGLNTLYDTCSYSVDRDIYSIEAGTDYIKVNYSIGDIQKTYIIPSSLPESQMNTYLDKMDASGQRQVKNYYRKIDINKLQATDSKAELLKKYPDLDKECVYALRDTTKDHLKEKLQECFAAAGFTQADMKADNDAGTKNLIFDVSVIYRIDGDQLVVEVPMEEIKYNPEYPIISVSVLPYFGAGGTQDKGYMFVPEGGGAMIDFNNGRTSQNPYVTDLYGWDNAISRKELIHETKVDFPVFGIAKNDSSFLCIMEDGASYASLTADISGRNNSYNTVSASYTVIHGETYNITGKSDKPVFVFEECPAKESIKQKYCFIDTDNYVDMALTYQKYLTNKYPNLTMKEDTSTPVAVNIIGAIDKVKHKFGFPVSVPVELTTYKEAKEMVAQLKKDGFENLSVKYSGWMNGGLNHSILTDIDLISELGGKKNLKSLLSYTKENQIPIYLDATAQYAKNSGIKDGFIASRDAARFLSMEEAELRDFSIISFSKNITDDPYYLLSPHLTQKMITNLKNTASEYNAYGVSFQDIGNLLSSDFNEKKSVTREESIKMQQAAMDAIKDAGLGIMINCGNEYAVAYADYVTDMDLSGSKYSIINRSVPVYQIALHGYVNYSGNAINLSNNSEETLLKSAETGAGLYFTFMKESATVLQNSKYTNYFGADIDTYELEAQAIYQKYNDELGNLYNQTIVDHYYATDQVTVTTYEDGTKVYVNYGRAEYKNDEITVNARDYAVKKGE